MPAITIYNADCFDVFPSITNQSIDLILADLPYGTTACKWDSVLPLPALWNEYGRVLKENGAIVLTAAQPFTWTLCASNPTQFRYELIWEKSNGTNPMLVHKQPFRSHENVLIFYAKQPTYNPQMVYGHSPYAGFSDTQKKIGEVYGTTTVSKHKHNTDGSRFPRSVLYVPQERGGHPTQKPVALMEWLIKSYSNVNDLVLDNTMGTGATGVAAIRANRNFIGIELDQGYFEIAKTRMGAAYASLRPDQSP